MAGKILYLGCASFGCAYVGVYALIKRIRRGERKALYLLLSSFLEFMVMCFYLLHSSGLYATRFDLFLQGRYFDFAIPLLSVIGFYELLKEAGAIRKLLVSIGVVLFSGVISMIVTAMNRNGFSDPHGALMIGMSYFLDENDYAPMKVMIFSILMTIAVVAGLCLMFRFYKKSRNAYLLLLSNVLLICLSYHACSHYINVSQSYILGDVVMADTIKSLRDDGHGGDVVLLYEGGFEYIDTVQMRLRDEHVRVRYPGDEFLSLAGELCGEGSPVIEREAISGDMAIQARESVMELASDRDLVLVDYESPLRDVLERIYARSREAGHFILYYNDGGY
jgi:hypothetical protein